MAMPRTWLLASPHAGDNSQLFALADALGWPYETKRLVYHQSEKLFRFMSRATLAAVNRERSDAISAPFPDLIIAAGRAAEAITAWIRRYGNRDVRIVFLGTPWSALDGFDLVIVTPQYALGERPNVLVNSLPLHCIHPEPLTSAAEAWWPRLQHLPQPWTALLVGGSSGPYVFGPSSAERLGRQASRLVEKCGGSLLVSTSARTSGQAAQFLATAITVPNYYYDWAPYENDNPYLAFLALAEQIIVTADSISMISEACATRKPVLLFDLETGRQSMRAEEKNPRRGGSLPPPYWRGRSIGATGFRLAMRFGPPKWSRDLRIVHRNVVEMGIATWFGEAPQSERPVSAPADLQRAVSRIRALFSL